jgi:phage baseplate assembly protein W
MGVELIAVIVDFPGTGEMVTPQGNIPVLTDQDALINAINLLLYSFRGERLYRPNEGGIIADNLLKPMSDDRAKDIHDDLTDGLAHQFNPHVTVSECTVIPDYDRNTYWITIVGYCPALRVSIYDKIGLRPLV